MSDLIDHDEWRDKSMKVLDLPNSYNTYQQTNVVYVYLIIAINM